MGKTGKLRCLFGLSKNRPPSPSLDKKLSLPKLLEKCPTQPNQYYRSGRDQGDARGFNSKPGKIETSGPTENLQSLPKDQVVVEEKGPKSNEGMPRCSATTKHTEQKNELPHEGTRADGLSSSRELPDYPTRKNTENNLSCQGHSTFHPYEKMIRPKRNPGFSYFSPTSAPSSPIVAEVEEKVFVVKKIKQTREKKQDSGDQKWNHLPDFPSESTSSSLEASGACKVVTPSAREAADSMPCNDCCSSEEPVKECDWGWLMNRPEVVAGPGQTFSRTCGCPNDLDGGAINRYINDPIADIAELRDNASAEVAFTVTEKGGKSLQFTIVESGIQVQIPPDVTSLAMTSRQLIPHETRRRDRRSRFNPNSTGLKCDKYHLNQKNSSTMTPSLASRATETDNLHSLRPRLNGLKGNEDDLLRVDEKGPPALPPRKSNTPHFELTPASYSKLIAYCGTNKLVPALAPNSQSTSSPPKQPFRTHHSQPAGSTSSTDPVQVNDLCRLAKVLETVEECTWYWDGVNGQDSKKVLRDAEPGTFLLRDSSNPSYLFSLSVKTQQGPTSIRIVYSDGTFRFDSEMDDTNSRRQGQQRGGRSSDHPNYVKRVTPVFTCVVNMVLFYTKHLGLTKPKARNSIKGKKEQCPRCSSNLTENSPGGKREESNSENCNSQRPEQFMCYWVNRNGRQEIPVLLSKPLQKTNSFPSLQRLCRQTLNVSQKLWINEHVIDQLPLPNPLKKYIKKYPYPV